MPVIGISGGGMVYQPPKTTQTAPPVAQPQSKVSGGTDADGDHDGSTGPDPGEQGPRFIQDSRNARRDVEVGARKCVGQQRS